MDCFQGSPHDGGHLPRPGQQGAVLPLQAGEYSPDLKKQKRWKTRHTCVPRTEKIYYYLSSASLVGCCCVRRACHLLRKKITSIGQIAQPTISLEKKNNLFCFHGKFWASPKAGAKCILWYILDHMFLLVRCSLHTSSVHATIVFIIFFFEGTYYTKTASV